MEDILDNQKNKGDMEVDKVTKYGFTAMEIAALNGRSKIVRILANHGANPNFCSPSGVPPFENALEGGHLDTGKLLKNS